MTKTISFRVEGHRQACSKCGSHSLVATVDKDGLCLNCSMGWSEEECVHGCRRPSDCIDCIYEENLHLKERLRLLEGESFEERTRQQCHSNWMLRMRRTMKAVAQVMRIDIWHQWVDCDDPVGPEPEVSDEDVKAFLYASGSTKESLEAGLKKVMAIVEAAKGKHGN